MLKSTGQKPRLLDTDLGSVDAVKKTVLGDADAYYMFVINQGTHWVGTSTKAFHNSGCDGPKKDITWQMGAASGMMIKVSKAA